MAPWKELEVPRTAHLYLPGGALDWRSGEAGPSGCQGIGLEKHQEYKTGLVKGVHLKSPSYLRSLAPLGNQKVS